MIERSCADGGKPSVLTKLCFGCATTYEAVHNAVLPRKKELDKIGVVRACGDAIAWIPKDSGTDFDIVVLLIKFSTWLPPMLSSYKQRKANGERDHQLHLTQQHLFLNCRQGRTRPIRASRRCFSARLPTTTGACRPRGARSMA